MAVLPSINAAAGTHTDISAQEAYRMIYSNSYPNLLIIDVRQPSDYNLGRLPNAINIPTAMNGSTFLNVNLTSWIEGDGKNYKTYDIIVYCGTATRSNYASTNLTDLGFTNVYDMSIPNTFDGKKAYSAWDSYVNLIKNVTYYDVTVWDNPHVGKPYRFELYARNSINGIVNYYGTINVTCSDPLAIITSADKSTVYNSTLPITNGDCTFYVFFGTSGDQSLTVTELANSSISGYVQKTVVDTRFDIVAQPTTVNVGSQVTINVSAYCPKNILQTLFNGTQEQGAAIHFTSTDTQAIFPSGANRLINGTGMFTVTLRTPGNQTITATADEFNLVYGTSQLITVTNTITPTPTPTPGPSSTPSPTPSSSPTPSPTLTPTPTPTPTPGPSSTPSPTPSSSPTPSPTLTPTPTPTPTPGPSPTPSPTPSSSPTPSPTLTPTPTPTPTPGPSSTPSPTPSSSPTPSPTLTPTPTPTPTTINNGNVIQLYVKDANNNPLKDVVVLSVVQPNGAPQLIGATNASGYVTFQNAVIGSYTFTLSKAGYISSANISANVDNTGQPIELAPTLLKSNSTQIADNTTINVLGIVLVVIVAVVGSGIYVYTSRRGKSPR